MIRWKDSVRFELLHGGIVLAIIRADAIFSMFGLDCWVTSLNDSVHKSNSKHYSGRAVDLRVHHMATEADREAVTAQLKSALGPAFTVLYESPGTPNAHLHIQLNLPPAYSPAPTSTV